jgi:uncharacterized protein (DUF1800 family)
MDRKEFLKSGFSKKAAAPQSPVRSRRLLTTGLAAYQGTFGKAELQHLLRRTLFGVKKSELDALSSLSLSQVVDLLITPLATPPAPPVNNYNATYADPNVALGSTWVNAPYTDGTLNFHRTLSFKSWWISQMLDQQPNITEKMVLFWHNHFATEVNTVQDARLSYHSNALLRRHALGNFKTLTRDITKDAAMLIYLNGYLNSKAAPDENYARELQELFTLGKGPDSKYTEDDVKAAARVLTGWRINRVGNPPPVYFDVTRHDTANKQFSSFFGNKVITGRNTSTAGDDELNDLLDMIFAQQEVAKYVCRRLYKFFVYYELTPEVETNVIAPLADIFRNNNYDIRPVLSALFNSEHFFDPLNRACYIKSPMDHLVGFSREWSLAYPGTANLDVQYGMWNTLRGFGQLLGQDLGDPPSVAGWPAYHQSPQFYELWINSDSYPKRNQFQDLLITTGYKIRTTTLLGDVYAMASQFSNPSKADDLIDESVAFLLALPIGANTRATLKSILLPGGIPDFNWTDEWNNYKNNPGNTTYKTIIYAKLMAFYKAIMNLAEYQLA